MVVHKRVHFGEKPYKCVGCGEGFTCTSQLKTLYKFHKQHNFYFLSIVDVDLFVDDKYSFSLNRPYLGKGFKYKLTMVSLLLW